MGIFSSPSSHPITLFREFARTHGGEWLTWLPETLRAVVRSEYGEEISHQNLQRLLAAASVATSDNFWTRWEYFHLLTAGLCGQIIDPSKLEEFSIGEMLAAADIAATIRDELRPLTYVPEFSEDVARFVAAQALNAGVWYLPPPLDAANVFTAKRRLHCRACGTVAEPMFDDGVCDVCSERLDIGGLTQLGSWRPNPEYVLQASNTYYVEQNPIAPVQRRLEAALQDTKLALKETSVDICVARILDGIEYAAQLHRAYQEQGGSRGA